MESDDLLCSRNAGLRKPSLDARSGRSIRPHPLGCQVSLEGSLRRFVLAIAKPRLAQQLVPFRLIVERNVAQAAPPVITGRGAPLWQEFHQGSDARRSSTTVLE